MKLLLAGMFAVLAEAGVGGSPLPDDFWFCADFDSTAELCGNAFLRVLPEDAPAVVCGPAFSRTTPRGFGAARAGFVPGRFGRGYAFLGPTNRCEGIFWCEKRPEALSDFPWENGSFACWYRTPEGIPDDAPGRAFGIGDFRFGLDQCRVFSCASGWATLPKDMREHVWRHFAMTWNAEGLRVYRDGQEIGFKKGAKGADPLSGGKCDFQIGTGGYASPAANLEMDEIAVFRHALSADEVRALAQADRPLREGRPKLLATPVSLPVYPRNSKNAALRMRVSAPARTVGRLAAAIGGRELPARDVTIAAGVSELDIPFDAVRCRPGRYDWTFALTGTDGRVLLDRRGTLTITPRFERDAYKVLSWGGYRDLSAAEMKAFGVNAANLHAQRHYALQRELAENGLNISMRVLNCRKFVPFDFDVKAIRRDLRSEFDHLRGLDAWTMTLMNSEYHGSGVASIGDAVVSPNWRALAERSLGRGLPDANRFGIASAHVDWKAVGRTPPSGVLGDVEPEIDALTWFYRTGHQNYCGDRASRLEIRALSPGNVCWSEPIGETWNLAAHHDEVCDWVYNVQTHATLACVRNQQAWARGAGKPYFPLLSTAYEHDKKFYRENPDLKGKDGKPARIFPCRTADDLAISCWQAVGAVACRDFGFFAIDTWGRGVENVRKCGRDLSKLEGFVAEPEDEPKFAAFLKSRFLPAAELLRDMPTVRAPIAVLQPVEARYMTGWSAYLVHDSFCNALGKAGLPYDVIPDAEIRKETLSSYRYIILPRTPVITRAHYDVLASLPNTTFVVDAFCPPELFPNAIRFDLQWPWRNKAALDALGDWLEKVRSEVRPTLAATSDEDGEFSAQTFHKEHRGARYVLVVNDLRERRESIMTQCMTNDWYRPYGRAQTITTHLPVFPNGATYEFGAPADGGGRAGNAPVIRRDYAAAEARLFCLYPRALAAPRVRIAGERIEIEINDVDGCPAVGRTLVSVELRDGTGALRDESGRYTVEAGRLTVPIYLADEDRAGFSSGTWRCSVRDLATGFANKD